MNFKIITEVLEMKAILTQVGSRISHWWGAEGTQRPMTCGCFWQKTHAEMNELGPMGW